MNNKAFTETVKVTHPNVMNRMAKAFQKEGYYLVEETDDGKTLTNGNHTVQIICAED